MPSLAFLTDIHVNRPVETFLRSLGHEVYRVTQLLEETAQDKEIAAVANDLELIVITGNRKHFRPLITREVVWPRTEFPRAGLMSFRCRDERAVPLLQRFMPHVELEYELRRNELDPRVIAEINENGMTIR